MYRTPTPTPSRRRGRLTFSVEIAVAAVLVLGVAAGLLAAGGAGRYVELGLLAVAVAVAAATGWPTNGHAALGCAAAYLILETLAGRLDASHLTEQFLLTAGVLGSVLAAGFARGDKPARDANGGTGLARPVDEEAHDDPWAGERPGQPRLRPGTLEYEVERARRSQQPLSVLAIRPDEHASLELADLIEDAIVGAMRAIDFVNRTAPSSFEVVLPEVGPEGARAVAERIRLRIDSTTPDSETGISVSIGVASYPADGPDHIELAAAAGRALERAAELGGNRTVLYSVPAGAPLGWGLSAATGTTPPPPPR